MLHVIPMSLLCPSKNEVAFKITLVLVINFDHMVILKATSFLEGHKRDMGMTFRITQVSRTLIKPAIWSIIKHGECFNE